uniref:Ig-like domain-containing protein n=1 Tax=Pygocentrus nattereri TaxID=42514 RepID=A0AAR2IQF6_PYGNA
MVKAINIAGETSSHAFLLVQDIFCFSAKQVLSFTQEVEDVYAKEKDTMVTFECETNEPFVKVKWLKNNAEIFSGDKYRMHSDRKVITAPTPVLDISEHVVDTVEPSEKIAGAPSDENTSQTLKHKFTFSFDDIGEVPKVFRELENISCSDGQTVILECIILGEPAPSVIWLAKTFSGPSSVLTKNSEEGVCKIRDQSMAVEDTIKSTVKRFTFDPVQLQDTSKSNAPLILQKDIPKVQHVKQGSVSDVPLITGCGLQSSGAEVKVSKLKKYRIISRNTTSCLELLNPAKADSGEYTCRASNQHGSDSYRTLHFSECCGTNIYLLLQSNSFLFLFLLL